MKMIFALLLPIFLGVFSASAQQPTFQDPLLDHLVGKWVLRGTIAGKQTTHDVVAEWVLNHQYLKIHEISREKNEKGQPGYEANVFIGWDQASSEYVCVWLDDYGNVNSQSLATAKRSGNEIPFLFHYKDGSSFHTTFAYYPEGNYWEWRLDAEKNGSFNPFARVKLTRK
ncbi:MAG: hypothetical protein JSS81_07675 [Acidobacteria bacterium]|nr:hypothetical protein [Acidobacteriota bacterium]